MFKEVVLACSVSVHCPILLETGMKIGDLLFYLKLYGYRRRIFLCQIGGFEITVSGWMGFQLAYKLKYLKNKMKNFQKGVFDQNS